MSPAIKETPVLYYRHYSFDLWLTLIRSNPGFKAERTRIFHRDFNYGGKSIEDVDNAFQQVSLMCNLINEKTGKNIDSDEMYLMVISLINDNRVDLEDIDIEKLYSEMEDLLFCNLPILYSAETIELLLHLKNKGDNTMSILSNTGFVKGVTLRKVLIEVGLHQFFDFQLYSDEAGLSKPNPELFKLMIQKIRQINKAKDLGLEDIIHVGDNPRADIAGADAVGIKSMLINSNNKPVLSLISQW